MGYAISPEIGSKCLFQTFCSDDKNRMGDSCILSTYKAMDVCKSVDRHRPVDAQLMVSRFVGMSYNDDVLSDE